MAPTVLAENEVPFVRQTRYTSASMAFVEAARDRGDGTSPEVLRGRAKIAGVALLGRGERPRRKREGSGGYEC